MAVDTRAKRASAIQCFKSFIVAPVTPDGDIAIGDRWHIGGAYSGIVYSAPAYYGVLKAYHPTYGWLPVGAYGV